MAVIFKKLIKITLGEGRIILQSAIKKRQAATQIISLKVSKYENMNVNINLIAG